jgi:hypothetical protein
MSGYDAASYDCDGHHYPRVTGILSILDKGYGLKKWGQTTRKQKLCNDYYTLLEKGRPIDIELLADAAEGYPDIIMRSRGDTGTAIHDALQAKLDPTKDDKAFCDEYATLYENCDKWIADNKLEPIKVEERLCSHIHQYGGTVDLIASQEYDGEQQIALIDFKTGAGVYDTSTLQLAAYAGAYMERHGDDANKWPDMCYIMHVDRDKYTFKETKHIHRYNKKTKEFEIEREFNAFLAVRACYRWRNNK